MWAVLSPLLSKRPTRRARSQGNCLRVEALEGRDCPSGGEMEWDDPTGHLDPTFGTGGPQSSSAGGYIARAMAVYPASDTTGNANKVVVAGGQYFRASNGSWTTRMAVARFNPDGSPDPTFNSTG